MRQSVRNGMFPAFDCHFPKKLIQFFVRTMCALRLRAHGVLVSNPNNSQ